MILDADDSDSAEAVVHLPGKAATCQAHFLK
jgi:hypothetical protein